MRVDVVSIFPDYLAGPLRVSLLGKAVERGLLDVRLHDLRQWTSDRHRTVDDTPYGGGAGMVMRPEPWGLALDALVPPAGPADAAGPGGPAVPAAPDGAGGPSWPGGPTGPGGPGGPRAVPAVPGGPGAVPRLVVPTPAGRPFTQAVAAQLAAEPWLVFACGRYEGIDQRVTEHAATRMPVEEVSLGDYVLAGGEAAVLVMIEAVARLLPGFLGNPESLAEESHAGGLLEYPVYTRPPVWRSLAVPDVLLSGDHGAVARWRRDVALRRTAANRPDLLAAADLTARDRAALDDLG